MASRAREVQPRAYVDSTVDSPARRPFRKLSRGSEFALARRKFPSAADSFVPAVQKCRHVNAIKKIAGSKPDGEPAHNTFGAMAEMNLKGVSKG
jgi:hypothetical protein